MKKRRWCPGLLVMTVTVMTAPVLSAQEQSSTQSPPAPEAMPILKKMSNFLAAAGRFSVTIHDGYDVVQKSGQKIEFGELRSVTVSRPDRLRIEVERSDGQKGSVFFDGKDITVYTADNNIYATAPGKGLLTRQSSMLLTISRSGCPGTDALEHTSN
jgi:hypothetical protein